MIVTLGLTALVAGVLVVTAYQLALPRIKENRQRTVEQAVFRVLPTATAKQTFVLSGAGFVATDEIPSSPTATAIHVGYDTNGKFAGIAAEGAARGYQDVIRLLYAYDPRCECITDMHVLRNNDTPGIGDRISKDPAFLANFKALAAKLNADKTGLEHRIVAVKHGKKTEAWQIDAISGASVTSRAVGRAINDSAQAVLPRVTAQLDLLTKPKGEPY
jgi:electron transport complex protein RnfG